MTLPTVGQYYADHEDDLKGWMSMFQETFPDNREIEEQVDYNFPLDNYWIHLFGSKGYYSIYKIEKEWGDTGKVEIVAFTPERQPTWDKEGYINEKTLLLL